MSIETIPVRSSYVLSCPAQPVILPDYPFAFGSVAKFWSKFVCPNSTTSLVMWISHSSDGVNWTEFTNLTFVPGEIRSWHIDVPMPECLEFRYWKFHLKDATEGQIYIESRDLDHQSWTETKLGV